MAVSGTSSMEGNHPSPNCCFLQARSSFTTDIGLLGLQIGRRIVKGQVRILPDSDKCHIYLLLLIKSPSLAHSSRHPLHHRCNEIPSDLHDPQIVSFKYFRKDAGWVTGIPMYSSR